MSSNRPTEKRSMPRATFRALRGSIRKWESIVDGTGHDEGPDNCALCKRFHLDYRRDDKPGCTGCPVASAGFVACMGSPYDAYCDGPTRENAQREVDFLKSLLPKEAT